MAPGAGAGPGGAEGTGRLPQPSPPVLAPRAGRSTPLPDPPPRGAVRLRPGQRARWAPGGRLRASLQGLGVHTRLFSTAARVGSRSLRSCPALRVKPLRRAGVRGQAPHGGQRGANAASGGAGCGRVWAPPALPPRRPAPSAVSARGSERSGDAAAPPRRSEVRGAARRRGRGGGSAGAAACASVRCRGRLPRAAPRPALRCGRGRGGCGLASLRAGNASFCLSSVSRLAPRMRGAGRAGKGGVTWGEGLFLGANAPPRAGRGC